MKNNALAMNMQEFRQYRNAYIEQQYQAYDKRTVNKFIKATDKKFGASSIVEYWKAQRVVVLEEGNLNLYAYIGDTDRFWLISSEPAPADFVTSPVKAE
jgi:hypothetical protein